MAMAETESSNSNGFVPETTSYDIDRWNNALLVEGQIVQHFNHNLPFTALLLSRLTNRIPSYHLANAFADALDDILENHPVEGLLPNQAKNFGTLIEASKHHYSNHGELHLGDLLALRMQYKLLSPKELQSSSRFLKAVRYVVGLAKSYQALDKDRS